MEMEFDVRLYLHDAVYAAEVSIDFVMVASVADVDDVESEVAVHMFLFGFGLDEIVGWAVDKLKLVLEELCGVDCSWVVIIRYLICSLYYFIIMMLKRNIEIK